MKKKFSFRVLIPAVLVIVLITAMLAVSGTNITSSDPLVSLSYLTGTFKTEILKEVQGKIDSESTQLETTFTNRLNGVSRATGAQVSATATHTSANIPAGSSYTVPANAEFLFLSGSAVTTTAGLVDMTEGVPVSINGELIPNHLYSATSAVTLRGTQPARILIRK